MEMVITAIIMLGHFRGQRLATKSRTVLRAFLEKKNPPEVRRYALFSLNRLLNEAKITPDYINFALKQLCDDRGLVPICSTTADNVAAQRAITKAGFVSRHRILEVSF